MRKLFGHTIVYLYRKYLAYLTKKFGLEVFFTSHFTLGKLSVNQLLAHECFAELEDTLRMDFFKRKRRVKCILKLKHML